MKRAGDFSCPFHFIFSLSPDFLDTSIKIPYKFRQNKINLMIMLFILSVIIGLAIGSFLNVVIYRLPRGESLITPPSHCPNCKSRILWYDNLPILSYLLLKGRCRKCKKPIPWRYPMVEGICALFFFLLFWHYSPSISINLFFILALIKALLFVSILIPVFFIDIEHQIIPDSLSYTLFASVVSISGFQGYLIPSLKGAAVGAGIFLLIFYLSLIFLHQPGMGIGDIKIAAGIGAFFGWEMALLAFFLSFFTGAVIAGVFLLLHLKQMKDRIPFGPFLVVGAFITLFFGKNIINLYFSLLW